MPAFLSLFLLWLGTLGALALPVLNETIDLSALDLNPERKVEMKYHPARGLQLTVETSQGPLLAQFDESPFQLRWSSQLNAGTPPYQLQSSRFDQSTDNRYLTHFIQPSSLASTEGPVNFLSVNGASGAIAYHVKLDPQTAVSAKNLHGFDGGLSAIVETVSDKTRVALIDADGSLIFDRLYTSSGSRL